MWGLLLTPEAIAFSLGLFGLAAFSPTRLIMGSMLYHGLRAMFTWQFFLIVIVCGLFEAVTDPPPAPDHGKAFGFMSREASAFRQMPVSANMDMNTTTVTFTITNSTQYRIGDPQVTCSFDHQFYYGDERWGDISNTSETYTDLSRDPESKGDTAADGPIKPGESRSYSQPVGIDNTDRLVAPIVCKVTSADVYRDRPQDKA